MTQRVRVTIEFDLTPEENGLPLSAGQLTLMVIKMLDGARPDQNVKAKWEPIEPDPAD